MTTHAYRQQLFIGLVCLGFAACTPGSVDTVPAIRAGYDDMQTLEGQANADPGACSRRAELCQSIMDLCGEYPYPAGARAICRDIARRCAEVSARNCSDQGPDGGPDSLLATDALPAADTLPAPDTLPTPDTVPAPDTVPPPDTNPLRTVSVMASADSFIDSKLRSSNYGSAKELETDLPDNGHGEQRALVRFEVPEFTGAVQSAKLRLHVSNGSENGPRVYQTETNWTEGGVTWDNRPNHLGDAIVNLAGVSKKWLSIDVRSVVTGPGAYSFSVVPEHWDGTDFHSRESAEKPELVLVIDASR